MLQGGSSAGLQLGRTAVLQGSSSVERVLQGGSWVFSGCYYLTL